MSTLSTTSSWLWALVFGDGVQAPVNRAAVPVVRLFKSDQRKPTQFDLGSGPDLWACSGLSTACNDFAVVPSPTETKDTCF